MATLDEKIGLEGDFLNQEYERSFCAICPYSPGRGAYTDKGLKCHGLTSFEEDFDKPISPIYPLPQKLEECPYFTKE